MSAARSGSDDSPAGVSRRQWRPARPGRGAHAVQVAEFQRSRVVRAAVAVLSEHGYAETTATAVIDRAGVSRKTFYDLFEDLDDCFLAAIDDCLVQLAAVAAPAYERERIWPECVRAALLEMLAFVEREPKIGTIVLSYLVGYGPPTAEPRASVLELLQGVVDEGRSQARPRFELSPLAAEVVVGGALAVIHARLRAQPRRLSKLVNELMWTVVLPYLGPAAAGRQLRRVIPSRATPPPRSSDPLRTLNMRLTHRTARVLEAIAEEPGASNIEISTRVGITDQGQMSKLLSRLAGLGLIESWGPGQPSGGANAWHLTGVGAELESTIRRKT
jgi:AcrR family transcriptional regulator